MDRRDFLKVGVAAGAGLIVGCPDSSEPVRRVEASPSPPFESQSLIWRLGAICGIPGELITTEDNDPFSPEIEKIIGPDPIHFVSRPLTWRVGDLVFSRRPAVVDTAGQTTPFRGLWQFRGVATRSTLAFAPMILCRGRAVAKSTSTAPVETAPGFKGWIWGPGADKATQEPFSRQSVYLLRQPMWGPFCAWPLPRLIYTVRSMPKPPKFDEALEIHRINQMLANMADRLGIRFRTSLGRAS